MILRLAQLPPLHGPNDSDYRGQVPRRALFLAPDAAQALLKVEASTGGLTYTDVFRDAQGSLQARRAQMRPNGTSPVQRPAFSPHNYGLAVDLDVERTLQTQDISYRALAALLESFGWFCHRRDGKENDSEFWHFNYLGPTAGLYLKLASKDLHSSWGQPVEERIRERHGPWKLTQLEVQQALYQLKFYSGALDGVTGPVTRRAIDDFKTRWDIVEAGCGDMTRRTLCYLMAKVEIVGLGMV